MSTRSRIGIENQETGKVWSVYCHYDGYLEGVGQTLIDHYKDREKVDELIALGDLSALGEEIGVKHDFDYGSKLDAGSAEHSRLRRMVLAYGRDRGENSPTAEDADAEAYIARATEGWEEFAYLYRQGVWFVREIGGDAGPMLVNANDPEGAAEKPWINVEGALRFGIGDHRAYAFVVGVAQ